MQTPSSAFLATQPRQKDSFQEPTHNCSAAEPQKCQSLLEPIITRHNKHAAQPRLKQDPTPPSSQENPPGKGVSEDDPMVID